MPEINKIARNGSITTDSMYWPIKQCLKIRIEIQVIWQCLSLSFEETWEINIAKKEFSNTVLWVWMVLAWFCRKNKDLASSCLLRFFANWKKEEVQHKYWFFWCLTFFQLFQAPKINSAAHCNNIGTWGYEESKSKSLKNYYLIMFQLKLVILDQ